MINIKKFLQGIGLIPVSSTAIDSKGEIEVLDADGRVYWHDGSAVQKVVGAATTDTLTNKTFNADGTGNSITNIENADIKAGAAIDATKIADGSVSNTEFQYIGGLTSDAQTQLNTKITASSSDTLTNKTIDGDNNTVQDLALTSLKTVLADASKFIVRDASGIPVSNTKAVPTGDVVGTSDSQTLTNKTLTSPVIGTISNTGTLTLPTSTDTLVGRATTDTLTNKTLTSPTINTPTIDVVSWDDQASTPANPSAGVYKMYFKTDGQLYKLDSNGVEAQVGSGVGGLNLMVLDTAANNWAVTKTTNSNAEVSVGDWAAYADAAATSPVDMTGGTPNTAIARTTASEINGTGSFEVTISSGATRQGEGVSCLVNVPTAYRNRNLTLEFPFTLSGTVTEDDLRLFVYDVTNSVVITPFTGGKLLGSAGTARCSFPVSSNTAQIRVGVHIARSVNTGAVTFIFDDVNLSPVTSALGVAGSDWFSYTPTFTGFGTVSTSSFWYRRIGDSIEISGKWTDGTPTAVEARISLPSSLLIDSTKVPAIKGIGNVYQGQNGAAAGYVLAEPNVSYMTFGYQGTSNTGLTKINGSAGFGVGVENSLQAVVPISGWSSNVSMAESSTFFISNYLANGSRVTSTPTALGQYRSYLRNAGASTWTETNGSPTATPSAANGITVYGGNQGYASADASNQPSRYEIFVGKNKTVELQWYSSTGKTGYVDVTPHTISTNMYGYLSSYDPTTGILNVLPNIVNQSGTHYIGINGNGVVYLTETVVYLDVKVSENALAVGVDSPRSEVTVDGYTGYGSTNTRVVQFANTRKNSGTAITYAADATNGSSWTINESGIYSVYANGAGSGGAAVLGLVVNGTALTTDPQSLTYAQGLRAVVQTPNLAGAPANISWTGFLSAGDIVRVQGNNVALTNSAISMATVTKVSN